MNGLLEVPTDDDDNDKVIITVNRSILIPKPIAIDDRNDDCNASITVLLLDESIYMVAFTTIDVALPMVPLDAIHTPIIPEHMYIHIVAIY